MGKLLSRAYLGLAMRLRREEGQALVEYALIGVLVAVVVSAALTPLGTAIKDALDSVAGKL